MSFSPLDSDLRSSSILVHGPTVLGIWCFIISQKDEYGVVSETPESVARSLSADVAIVERAWKLLTSPDPKSRHKEFDGRRLIPHSEGRWLVVAHNTYRDKHSKQRRSTAVRDSMREMRDRKKREKPIATSWSREACEDWETRFGLGSVGTQAGKIGKALKPLVTNHTWEVVRPSWRRYLTEENDTYTDAVRFASKFNVWLKENTKLPKAQQMTLLTDAWLKWKEGK